MVQVTLIPPWGERDASPERENWNSPSWIGFPSWSTRIFGLYLVRVGSACL